MVHETRPRPSARGPGPGARWPGPGARWPRRAAIGLASLAGLLFLLVFAWHLLLLRYGVSSFSTFVVFLVAGLAAVYAACAAWLRRRTGGAGPRLATLRLLVAGLFVSLLGAELVLRHGVARYPSYGEVSGSGGYTSPWRSARGAAALRRRFQPDADLWLISRVPNREVRVGGSEFSFVHRFNSIGLRDEEPPGQRAPSELRIVALGDSFTEGVGAEWDAAWPKALEREIAAGGRPLRVMNAGASGSDPFFSYVLLETALLAYGPDIVIVAVNHSDVDDVRVRGGMERFRPDRTVAYRGGPRWEWLYGTSFIARHVVHDLLGYDESLVKRSERAAVDAAAVDRIYQVLQRFQSLADARGFELVVVVHPLRDEATSPDFGLEPLVERLGAESQIRVVDLHRFYNGPAGIPEPQRDDYYWRLDGHQNARGYALFARGVAEALREWGLVPGS